MKFEIRRPSALGVFFRFVKDIHYCPKCPYHCTTFSRGGRIDVKIVGCSQYTQGSQKDEIPDVLKVYPFLYFCSGGLMCSQVKSGFFLTALRTVLATKGEKNLELAPNGIWDRIDNVPYFWSAKFHSFEWICICILCVNNWAFLHFPCWRSLNTKTWTKAHLPFDPPRIRVWCHFLGTFQGKLIWVRVYQGDRYFFWPRNDNIRMSDSHISAGHNTDGGVANQALLS